MDRIRTTLEPGDVQQLKTAAHLYREAGFKVAEEKTQEIWGAIRTEQRYDLTLQP